MNTTGFDLWNLSKLAAMAEQGWFFLPLGRERVAVHPDRDCEHRECPCAGRRHTHEPTEEDLRAMQNFVTRYNNLRREVGELERMVRDSDGRQKDIDELNRLYVLDDPCHPRPAAPREEWKPRHTLNLLRTMDVCAELKRMWRLS